MSLTTTRALVLARGLGTRMQRDDAEAALTPAQQRAADAGHKALMPIAGRPFLDYVLDSLAEAGLRQVGLVVAPQHDALSAHYAAQAPSRLVLTYVVQEAPLGTANAVLAAAAWTQGETFLVMNADNLYPVAALRDLASLDEPALPAFDADDLVRTSNISEARIGHFALIEMDADGYLLRIVEKPSAAKSDLRGTPAFRRDGQFVSMNLWRFDARIFDACRDVGRSARGEYELPEAVGLAVRRGLRIRAIAARGPVLDLSRRADARDIERRLAGVVPRP